MVKHFFMLMFLITPGIQGGSFLNAVAAPISLPKYSYHAEVNPKDVVGAFNLGYEFHFSPPPKLTFEDLVSIYRDTALGDQLGAALTEKKAFPLNLVQSKTQRQKIDKTHFYFHITGWAKGLKIFTSKESRLNCVEMMTSTADRRTWWLRCNLDLDYKDSTLYLADFKSDISCYSDTKLQQMGCSYDANGVTKKISVPGVAQVLFGMKSFSATQSAYKWLEDTLHFGFTAGILSQKPLPYESHVQEAVDTYLKSAQHQEAKAVADAFPTDLKSTRPYQAKLSF